MSWIHKNIEVLLRTLIFTKLWAVLLKNNALSWQLIPKRPKYFNLTPTDCNTYCCVLWPMMPLLEQKDAATSIMLNQFNKTSTEKACRPIQHYSNKHFMTKTQCRGNLCLYVKQANLHLPWYCTPNRRKMRHLYSRTLSVSRWFWKINKD